MKLGIHIVLGHSSRIVKVFKNQTCATTAILENGGQNSLLGPLIAKLLLKGPTNPAHGVRASVCVQKLNLRNYKV